MQLLTIRQFAEAINVCPKIAREMVRSDTFIDNKISFDISTDKKDRKYKLWRISLDKYYSALEKGILSR